MSLSLDEAAMTPPPGQVPNFENPPSNNTVAWGAYMMMLVVSTLSVGVRLYGRVIIMKQPKIEDVLLLLGFGAFIVALWTDLMFIRYPGYFVHTWHVKIGTEIEALYYVFLFGTFYSIALAMIKIAIPLDWVRLFVPLGSWKGSYFWWGSMGIVALQSSFLIVIVVLLNVQCLPHEAIWDLTKVADAKCIPLPTLQKLSASIHFITDVIILLLPQRVIWHLNLSLKKKLGIAVVFSLGALGVVCSVFRLVDTLILSGKKDVMFYTGPVLLWCTAEMTCGFFVACAPVLPRVVQDTPFLRRIFGTALSASGSGGGPTGGSAAVHKSAGISGTGTSHTQSRKHTRTHNTYSQIDEEEGMAMGSFARTESTEQLRGDPDSKNGGGGILRTTQITVSAGGVPEGRVMRPERSHSSFRA